MMVSDARKKYAVRKLLEQKQQWTTGYYVCLGKSSTEIDWIFTNDRKWNLGEGLIKHSINVLKQEIGTSSDVGLLSYFKEKKIPPFKETHY